MDGSEKKRTVTSMFTQYRGLRREIYVLFFGRVVTNLGAMVWPMLTMILSRKMGMNAQTISFFFVASGALMLPANLLGGRLADKYDKKRIIVAADAVSVLCYLISAALPLSLWTVASMVFAGILQSMEYPAYNALVADLTLTKDRDRAFSLQYLGSNLGLVLSPTIAGLLFEKHLPLAFLISGVSIGISTILIARLVQDVTPVNDTDTAAVYQAEVKDADLWEILKRNPILTVYTVAIALYYAAYGQYSFLMPLDMATAHGEDGAVLFGTVSSLNCIIVVIFTPVITRVFEKLTDVRKILVGELLAGAGYALFLLLLGRIPVYYAAITLFTWGEIFTTIADGPYISNRIPASHRGRINGLTSVLGSVIQGGAELGVGALYDRFGSLAAWTLVLSVLGAACFLTVLLIGRDKKAYPALYTGGEGKVTK